MSRVSGSNGIPDVKQSPDAANSRKGFRLCLIGIAALFIAAVLVIVFIGMPVSARHAQGLPGANVGMMFLLIAGAAATGAIALLASRAEKHYANMKRQDR